MLLLNYFYSLEGAWKHAEDHFRRINGTSQGNFEGHQCEIIWRNHCVGKNICTEFHKILKEVYNLKTKPVYQHSNPVFDTWNNEKISNI